MAKRRRYSAEFKREAVELTRRPQASVSHHP
jgi:transposase-like protein